MELYALEKHAPVSPELLQVTYEQPYSSHNLKRWKELQNFKTITAVGSTCGYAESALLLNWFNTIEAFNGSDDTLGAWKLPESDKSTCQ